MLVDEVTIDQAAAPTTTLWALLVAFAGAALLVVPSLVWMLVLTGEGRLEHRGGRGDSSQAVLERLQAGAGRPTTGDG
jgi:hypothetical protein